MITSANNTQVKNIIQLNQKAKAQIGRAHVELQSR